VLKKGSKTTENEAILPKIDAKIPTIEANFAKAIKKNFINKLFKFDSFLNTKMNISKVQ